MSRGHFSSAWVYQQSSWDHNLAIVFPSVRRQLSMNLMHGFLSNFISYFPKPHAQMVLNFRKQNWWISLQISLAGIFHEILLCSTEFALVKRCKGTQYGYFLIKSFGQYRSCIVEKMELIKLFTFELIKSLAWYIYCIERYVSLIPGWGRLESS